MNNPNLPVGPLDEDPSQLPARRDAETAVTVRQNAAVLDLLRDGRSENPDEIDLLAYWRILAKRRWLVLSVVGACVALALVVTLMTTPMYRATAVIKIDNVSQQVVQTGEAGTPFGTDRDFLTTQVGLLSSRSLAERVAEDLRLDRAGLARLQAPSWFERLKGTLRPAPVADKPVPTDSKMAAAERAAGASLVSSGLRVEPQRNSRLVNISFESPIPQFAAQVANAIADGYIASEIDRTFGASSYAKTYLEEQLALTKGRLEQSERTLVEFAQKENLVTVGEAGQSLAGQNLGAINSSLAEAQAQRIRAQARWSQLQATSALPPDIMGSSLVPTLRQQRADLHRQFQEKLQVFKPDYPDMQRLKGQIDEMDRQISAEIANVRRSVRAEYDAAMAQEQLLQGQLSSLRTESLDTDSRSIQYNILKREVDTNRQLYDSLLQRYKTVGAASDVRPNNIAIIDRAQAPRLPVRPNSLLNLAIGLLLGLMLGVLLALVLEFLDDTLKTPEDVEQKLRLPVLGIVPKLQKQSVNEAAEDLRSAFSEAYRSVRTALQFSTDHGVPKVLLLTSAGPGEGKSTSALALARNFAQLGKRVLLIEADMRNPSLHKSLDLRSDKGLSNLLSGAATLQDVVLDTADARLDVILAGTLPPNPAELLSGSRMVSLLSIAGQHYDQVVIDGPPVMGIADGPLLANCADATLMVVDSGRTKISNAQAALKRLLVARSRVIGVLLTKYDAKVAGYGYHYESYYAYGGPAKKLTGKR